MSQGFTAVTGSVVIHNPTKTPGTYHLSKRNMQIRFQDKFPVPPPNPILALKPPRDSNGEGRWRSFSGPSAHRWRETGSSAGTWKVLVSVNAILHTQRESPEPQPAREALADVSLGGRVTNTWPSPSSDTVARSLGVGLHFTQLPGYRLN